MAKNVLADSQESNIGLPSIPVGVSRDAAFMFACSVFVMVINIGLGLYLARGLDKLDYGRLVYFSNLFLLAMLIIGFGLTARISSELSRAQVDKQKLGADKTFYSLLTVRMVTIAPLVVVGFVSSLLMRDDLYIYVAAAASMAVLVDFLLGSLQGLQRVKRAGFIYILQPIVYLSLLFFGAASSVQLVTLAINASFAVTLIAVVVNLKGLGISWPRKDSVSWEYVRDSLLSSGQIYGIAFIQMAYSTYALIWLGTIGKYAEAAMLGIPLTLVRMFPSSIVPVVSTVFYPRMCRIVAKRESEAAHKYVLLFVESISIVSISVMSILMVYPAQVLELVYSVKYIDSWLLLVVLAPMVVILAVESILTMAMLAIEQPRSAIIALSVRLILFVVFALMVLIEHVHDVALWFAISYLVSASVGLMVQIAQYSRWSQSIWPYRKLVMYAAASFAVAGLLNMMLPDLQGGVFMHGYKMIISGSILGLVMAGLFLKRANLSMRQLASGMLGALKVVIAVALVLGSVSVTRAQDSEPCAGTVVDAHWLELRCTPGFAGGNDRIRIYLRDGTSANRGWQQQLDYENAVWVFEPGSEGRAKLLIDFHRVGESLVADVYDDVDGDGEVRFTIDQGRLAIREVRENWVIRVIAKDGWWVEDQKVNYNLDMLVDGPLRGSFGADFLYDYRSLLATDGRVDYEIHVRDPNGNGRPDYEWRQDWPPLSEDPRVSGYYRTSITHNTEDDEVPIAEPLFWPFLSSDIHEFVKDYNESPAPIQVDWERGRIVQIGEIVTSRGNPGNYFVYSVHRVKDGQIVATNFENPFAFYDLAQAGDGIPDTAIRFEVILPGEILPGQIVAPTPVNIVEYAWGREHNRSLNYQVSMAGRQPVDETIQFPEFAITAIPFEKLPYWTTEHTWDAATFVEAEKQPYWTAEVIYEWNIEEDNKILPFRYLTGVEDSEPVTSFSRIVEGFRGEYSLDFSAQPYVYFSPIDRKLHLLKAEGGQWNMGAGREIRYRNLGGDYINEWRLVEQGRDLESLRFAGGYLLHADDTGLKIVRADVDPALFTTLPPRTPAEWTAIDQLLDTNERDIDPADFAAIMRQFDAPASSVSGASLRDYRLISGGFRFVLDVQPGFNVRGEDLAALRGLPAGSYAVTFDGQFHVEPATPPAVSVAISGASLRQLQASALLANVRNDGLQDLPLGQLVLQVTSPSGDVSTLSGESVTAFSESSVTTTVPWTPSLAGEWTIEPRLHRVDGQIQEFPAQRVIVQPAHIAAPEEIVDMSVSASSLALLALIVAACVVLAGSAAWSTWGTRQEQQVSNDNA